MTLGELKRHMILQDGIEIKAQEILVNKSIDGYVIDVRLQEDKIVIEYEGAKIGDVGATLIIPFKDFANTHTLPVDSKKEDVYNKGYIALQNFIYKNYDSLKYNNVPLHCMNSFIEELSKVNLKLISDKEEELKWKNLIWN